MKSKKSPALNGNNCVRGPATTKDILCSRVPTAPRRLGEDEVTHQPTNIRGFHDVDSFRTRQLDPELRLFVS